MATSEFLTVGTEVRCRIVSTIWVFVIPMPRAASAGARNCGSAWPGVTQAAIRYVGGREYR
jgi:hypothetical protein